MVASAAHNPAVARALGRAVAVVAALSSLAPAALRAQVPSAIAPMPISRAVAMAQAPGESFGLSMSSTIQTSPVIIRDSTAGTAQTYSGSVVLTPTWDLSPSRFVTLYAYVTQPLTNGATTIPASVIEASALGGTGSATGAWSAFSATVDGHPFANTLTLVDVSGKTRVVSTTEQITVRLRLNTTNLALVAGRYTGIITFGARVQ